MEKSIQLSPYVYTHHDVRISAHSESQRQLREADCHLPTYVLYGYGDTALFLHAQVVELRGEFLDDIITSTSLFLPLMHTWTYRTSEGPPGGPPYISSTLLLLPLI